MRSWTLFFHNFSIPKIILDLLTECDMVMRMKKQEKDFDDEIETHSHIEHFDPQEKLERRKQWEKDLSTVGHNKEIEKTEEK